MWYLLQLAIMIYVIYLYTEVIPNPASGGQIILFALLLAYCVTWLLSRTFWLVGSLWRHVAGAKRDSDPWRGQLR